MKRVLILFALTIIWSLCYAQLEVDTYQVLLNNPSQQEETAPPDSLAPDVQPTLTSRANPVYPEEAVRTGVEGTVWVKIWVSAHGEAKQVVVLKSTNALFNESAIDAARKFAFTPAYIKEKPVDCWVSVPFKFKLAPKTSEVRRNAAELPKIVRKPTVIVVQGPEGLKKLLQYPGEAVKKQIEGTVHAEVILNDNKNIAELKIKEGVAGGCSEEVLRALSTYKFTDDNTQHNGYTFSIVVQFILPRKK
ncbi:MAG: TonB family protein [Ignavibacteriae bacterium]|nr:TonB family protein [Ignavibacteriota bacterium]